MWEVYFVVPITESVDRGRLATKDEGIQARTRNYDAQSKPVVGWGRSSRPIVSSNVATIASSEILY